MGKSHFKSRKTHFRIRKYIKVRKPHFKLPKALFKRVLERNCKNRNVLEFDVKKDGGIIFFGGGGELFDIILQCWFYRPFPHFC